MIKRVTLKKQAYDYLLNAITSEEIKPLEVYSEQYFASLLDISRTPIREAVLQLSQEGFLQIHPNKGFSVRAAGNQEINEIFGLRCAIEGYCAMYLAKNSETAKGKAVIATLKNLLAIEKESYSRDEAPAKWMENDTQFHSAIIDFADNRLFYDIMDNLRSKIKMTGVRSLYKDGRKADTMKEHQAILDAICSGDEMQAYNAMRNHFMVCIDVIVDGIK